MHYLKINTYFKISFNLWPVDGTSSTALEVKVSVGCRRMAPAVLPLAAKSHVLRTTRHTLLACHYYCYVFGMVIDHRVLARSFLLSVQSTFGMPYVGSA